MLNIIVSSVDDIMFANTLEWSPSYILLDTARYYRTKSFSRRICDSNRMELFNNSGHRGNQPDSGLELCNVTQSNVMLHERNIPAGSKHG